jgi:hypothetical protein
MNNALPIHQIPDGYASFIQNMTPNGLGWEHVTDNAIDITLPETYDKIFQWFPPYTYYLALATTAYVYIGFRTGKCYLVYQEVNTPYAWKETATELFDGVSVANVQVAFDSVQFLFVDGRDNNRAKRIMINPDGTIYAADKGMDSGYLFPVIKTIIYSDESGQGTGIGQGAIYGWCVTEVNEFGEEGLPTPTLWIDAIQWQRRGTIDADGTYLYDSNLQGSLKAAVITHTLNSANAKRLNLYRTDAYASESVQPITTKRLVTSITLSQGVAVGDEIDISDSYPYGLIELDLDKDSAPAGDDICLLAGTSYVANASKQYSFPTAIERIIAITLRNPNPLNYVNRDFFIDLFDEKIKVSGLPYLPNFYWETGDTFTGNWWSPGGGVYTHDGTGIGHLNPLLGNRTDIEAGVKYIVKYTINDTGAGSITAASLGGTAITGTDLTNGAKTVTIVTTNTNPLSFTPSADFVGTISATVEIYKDGASVWDGQYSASKTRILDSDFITPLKVYIYNTDEPFTYGDGTVIQTRKFAKITIPEMPASTEKTIYFVVGEDALPSYPLPEYPCDFYPIADYTYANTMYSYFNCNPVRDENTIICMSNDGNINLSKWQNSPSTLYEQNKANVNYNPVEPASAIDTERVNQIVPFDAAFQSDTGDTSTRPYYPNTGMIYSTADAVETITFNNPSIFMNKKGYGYFWFSYKPTSMTGLGGTVDLVTLSESGNSPRFRIVLSEVDTGGGNWYCRIGITATHYAGASSTATYVLIPLANATNTYPRFFVAYSWKYVVSTDGWHHNDVLDLALVVLDEFGNNGITVDIGRIWRLSQIKTSDTDRYEIDESQEFETQFHYCISNAYDIRISHPFVQMGEYLGDLGTYWYKMAYQFAKFAPYFPIEYVGIDYEVDDSTSSYHNISNVSAAEITLVNDTKPGRIAWMNNEQNVHEEILRILPLPSAKDTDEHGVILIWTANSVKMMPLLNDNRIVPYLSGIGLDAPDLLCEATDGVMWKYQDDIYLYTTQGLRNICKDESGLDRFKVSSTFPTTTGWFVFDNKTGRLWIADPTNNLSYVYDQKKDCWFQVKQTRTGGYYLPLGFLQNGYSFGNEGNEIYKKGTAYTTSAYFYTNSLGRKVRRYRILGNLNNQSTIGAEVYFNNAGQAYELMTYSTAQWEQTGNLYKHTAGKVGTLVSQFIPVVGQTYTVKYKIGAVGVQNLTDITFGGFTSLTGLTKTTGDYSLQFTATADGAFTVTPHTSDTNTIENIIIYETNGGQHITGVAVNNNNWSSLPGLKGDDVALLINNTSNLTMDIEAIEVEDNQ